MRIDEVLFDFSFPSVHFGDQETPWNLHILLYEGGAQARTDCVEEMIASGALGKPKLERLELVRALHEQINLELEGGGSREYADKQILNLRYFFRFAESKRHPLTMEAVTGTFCAWADLLLYRTRNGRRPPPGIRNSDSYRISMGTAYGYASAVGNLLDKIFDRHTSAMDLTRLERKGHRKSAVGIRAEKQNLSDTFAFGHLLQDICDGLPLQTVLKAPLPVKIALRSGKSIKRMGHYTGLREIAQETRLGERYPLANLRIEAELHMFIGQTGMNLTPAVDLKLRRFSYSSYLNGYQVKEYKARRGGDVLFEIFAEYRPHFERYLEWRRKIFPRSKLLFPFIGMKGSRLGVSSSGHRLRKICREQGIAFVSPLILRNTRINWLLRETANPELTAEMAQHLKGTLLSVYKRPSVQTAIVESAKFWSKNDPHSARTQAVAPGGCTGKPKEIESIPRGAPRPDCDKASGCLWCVNHRDVDSFEYVWSLASFGQLKLIELSKARLPHADEPEPPSKLARDRILEKLRWFERSNDARRSWVHEAQERINEGDYHPDWRQVLLELEGME
ncbi:MULTISPECIES: site-specific integrase [Cupriavidus]|uniref:Site-specific integrase n=1 Tax=Cupriavidus pauculus TaxID=82633 RepID=A0A3G8H2E2_9BURK|nr:MULTISPECIES: site-specific integrase [Cupriavidus]AZG14479.1 site-specific integrase [Cupriavidus pauculus]MBY4732170.1 site-specific integrase [Cupriavidus pauculus]